MTALLRTLVYKKECPGVSRMAQWIKMLAVKPDGLSSVLGIHTEEGEN